MEQQLRLEQNGSMEHAVTIVVVVVVAYDGNSDNIVMIDPNLRQNGTDNTYVVHHNTNIPHMPRQVVSTTFTLPIIMTSPLSLWKFYHHNLLPPSSELRHTNYGTKAHLVHPQAIFFIIIMKIIIVIIMAIIIIIMCNHCFDDHLAGSPAPRLGQLLSCLE